MSTDTEFLTPAEVAVILKINREVLRRLSSAGKIPGAFKVGGQWRYRRSSLLQWEK